MEHLSTGTPRRSRRRGFLDYHKVIQDMLGIHPLADQEFNDAIDKILAELAAEEPRTVSQVMVRPQALVAARTRKEKMFNVFLALVAGYAGAEVANLIVEAACSFQRTYWDSRTVSLKRPREEDNDAEGSRNCKKPRLLGTDQGRNDFSGDENVFGAASGEGDQFVSGQTRAGEQSDKREVAGGPLISGNKSVDEQVLWADDIYDDDSDSSYAPSTESSEDEDDHLTKEELDDISEYIQKFMKYEDLDDIEGDLSSDGESDLDSDLPTVRWKDYPSGDETDSDDPDYVPPAWDFEDILELVGKPCYQELDEFRYVNELIDRGPLSDSGIGDSDSDPTSEHLHDPSTLRRSLELYEIPQHLKKYSSLPAYLRPPFDRYDDGEPFLDLRKGNRKWHRTYAHQLWAEGKQRVARETVARLDLVLSRDPLPYAFDDEEWKGFENPRRSMIPRQ